MNPIAAILLVFLFQYTFAAEQNCYWPNRRKVSSSDYKPCGSNGTTFNTCCRPDYDECLENGLCLVTISKREKVIRGACTAYDWSGCQSICPKNNSGSEITVTKCDDGKYCCHTSRSLNFNCCDEGVDRYTLLEPRSSRTPVAVIAGGTVGGVVGLAIILGLGWWFWRRRRVRSERDETTIVDEKLPKPDPAADSSRAEADAGPDNVLAESDSRPTKTRGLHEMEA